MAKARCAFKPKRRTWPWRTPDLVGSSRRVPSAEQPQRHASTLRALLAEYLGMSADSLRYVQTDPLGGSASGQAVQHAAMSIISGYASTVLILGGDILQSAAGAPAAQRQMAGGYG